jgi:hypothetical protein
MARQQDPKFEENDDVTESTEVFTGSVVGVLPILYVGVRF